ncbi:hypothetical protein QBC39DRAFT_436197 [Podospora conica]|nr:hypothetical protein QBC39DRAFT_436197 [Schizothecium conicum]
MDGKDKAEKEQPWKKVFPPQATEPTDTGSPAEGSSKDGQATEESAPWKGWKPNPDLPDEKPWYQWMNDPSTNPNLGKNTNLSGEASGTNDPVEPSDRTEPADTSDKAEPADPPGEKGDKSDPVDGPDEERGQGTVAEGG